MWIKPVAFTVKNRTIAFGESAERMPLPPWSGVPVALEIPVDRETLTRMLQLEDVGILYARNEEGDDVHCPAVVDVQASHTCETDTMLLLVQCGPFEYDHGSDRG